MEFEWDPTKADRNRRKHGVTFREAATVFYDPLEITFADPDRSVEERRYITLGLSSKNRILLVVHCDRDDRIRIVSARIAKRREVKGYEEGIVQD